MAFGYHHFDKGAVPPIEYHPGKAGEDFTVGEALTLGDGGLTKCAATDVPTHICVGPRMTDGTVPATRVQADIEYTATLAADGAALKVGDKVTISDDGLGVTVTTASGVAQITVLEGTGVGDRVRVRF